MSKFIVPVIGLLIALIFWVLWQWAAHAASADYCRPYARDLTQLVINRVWMKAYTACLNEDADPVLPKDFYSALKIILYDEKAIGDKPATSLPDDPPKPPAKPSVTLSNPKTPADICAAAKMHVVYKKDHRRWRCKG